MNQTPELPEAGWPHLRRAVTNLPAYKPDPTTWSRIETQLKAEEALTRAVPDLPQHEPDEALWDVIAARLSETALAETAIELPKPAVPGVVRALWPTARPLRRVAALAASLLLLAGVWWQQHAVAPATSAPRETLTFSEDEAAAALPAAAVTAAPDPLEQQGRQFIDTHCSSLPTVCASGEFRSLRTQLTELEAEEKELRQATRRFGQSPELLRQLAQLVTLKATITRELVQLLIS